MGSFHIFLMLALLPLAVDAGSLGANIRSMKRNLRVSRFSGENEATDLVAPFEGAYNIDEKRCATGYWHVACTHNVQTNAVRDYKTETPKEDREAMTVEVCWNFCKNVSGAQYFALSRGSECSCLPFFHDDADYAGKMCDQACDGDKTVTCGGDRLQDMYEMHDCNNLPAVYCKSPPPAIEYAKTFNSTFYRGIEVPCKNAKSGLTTHEQHCQVECNPGYYLKSNTIKCTEKGDRLHYTWAQIEGSATCWPVSCGPPPTLANALYSKQNVSYPGTVAYTCKTGYSLDQNATGETVQDVSCLVSATYSPVETCKPVLCGKCPSNPSKYPDGAFREKGDRVYQEECTFDCAEGYTLNEAADGEKTFAISCLHNGVFQEGPKCLPVKCGTPPAVAFAKKTGAAPPLEAGEEAIYKQIVNYACDAGYSIGGTVNSTKDFLLTCQSSGTYTAAPTCEPVLAAPVIEVNHSMYVNREYRYGDAIVYTCVNGYTMTGKAGGPLTATMSVGTNGEWEGDVPTCLPVECGTPPPVNHASVSSSDAINFESASITYTCDPGYSLSVSDNIWVRTQHTFQTSCQVTGIIPVQTCVNINDCSQRDCGPHGVCSDSANPGLDLMKNYDCTCDSGYQVTIGTSPLRSGEPEKICTNINDCPSEACGGLSPTNKSRGMCLDGLNTYTCSCNDGYDVSKSGSNETCTPKTCDVVKAVANADLDSPSVLSDAPTFETPTWNFTCHEGYSLDGTVEGEVSFWQNCTADGALTAQQICQKISCGSPPMVGNADMSPIKAELVFGEKVGYTCDTGYTLDSKASGETTFEVSCLKDGNLSSSYTASEEMMADFMQKHGAAAAKTKVHRLQRADDIPKTCLPVVCGYLPDQKNATWDKSKEYSFPEVASVQCQEGFSVDQSVNLESDNYKVACKADGTFDLLKECQPVICPTPQDVEHTTRIPAEGPYVFEDRVAYEVEAGYEVDGSNESYTCTCTSSGEWDGKCSKLVTVEPHDCGAAPEVEFGTVTGSTKFGGVLTAKADTGYFVDGIANGETEFTFSCQANGLFSERKTFAPCNCGLTPDVDNTAGAELTVADHTTSLLAVGHGKVHKTNRSMRLYNAVYKDVVTYTCKEGYRAVRAGHKGEVKQSEEVAFSLTCSATGNFEVVEGSVDDDTCAPVTCKVEEDDDEEEEEEEGEDDLMLKAKRATAKRSNSTSRRALRKKDDPEYIPLGATQTFSCPEGQSTDGTRGPSSLTYTETCKKNGKLSSEHTCQQIDWCRWLSGHQNCQIPGRGKCVNLVKGYTCNCPEGFEILKSGMNKVQCVAIDTCTPQGGYDNCGANLSPAKGSCNFDWPNYSCTCGEGYELAKNSEGKEICSSKYCNVLPFVPNATTTKASPEFLVGESATFTCATGYTTDAKVGGPTQFEVSCTDKKMAPKEAAFSQHFITGSANTNTVVTCSWTTGTCKEIATIKAPGLHYALDAEAGEAPKGFLVAELRQEVEYCTMAGVCHTVGTCPTRARGVGFNKDASGTVLGYYIFCQDGRLQYCPTSGTCTSMLGGQSYSSHEWGSMSVEPAADGSSAAVLLAGTGTAWRCPLTNNGAEASSCNALPGSFGNVRNVDYLADGSGKVTGYMVVDGSWTLKKCPPEGHECEVVRTTAFEISDARVARAPNGTTLGLFATRWSTNDLGPVLYDFHIAGPSGAISFPDGQGLSKNHGLLPYSIYAPSTYRTEGVEQCKKLPCAAPATMEHATVQSGEFYYGEVATYTCEEGYESSLGGESFTSTCLASGEMSAPNGKCKPKSCGAYPDVPKAILKETAEGTELLYGEDAEYKCQSGYTLTGVAGGEKEFELKCLSSGYISQIPSCQAVSCGKVAEIEHASTPAVDFYYPSTTSVSCDYGYTTTGEATGMTEFSLTCQADGTWTPAPACSPILCGSAPTDVNAVTDTKSFLFQETATYTCKTGFSVGGTAAGESSYSRMCMVTGTFTEATGCSDIDHCIGNPCGALGACTDVPASAAPGYTCTCQEGAKVRTNEDGSEYCTQDQCHGNPCGKGHCIDLVPFGGEEGEYACECDTGYSQYTAESEGFEGMSLLAGNMSQVKAHSHTSTKTDGPTCKRNICGILPAVAHTEHSSEGYYYQNIGVDVEIDRFEEQPLLKAFDTAKYTCSVGYSVNGHPAAQSANHFQIACTANGEFDREVDVSEECQPVHCDKLGLPVVQNSYWTKVGSAGEDDFVFSDTVEYKCHPGFYFNVPEGTNITSTCQADSTFTSVTDRCEPISCKVPTLENAEASRTSLLFTESITYSCKSGFAVDGNAGRLSFTGVCDTDGSISFALGEGSCETIKCPSSSLPIIEHSTHSGSDEDELPLGTSVSYTCAEGYKFETGMSVMTSVCQSSGQMSAISAPCVLVTCEVPGIANGAFAGLMLPYGNTMQFSCQEGYISTSNMKRSQSVKCKADGSLDWYENWGAQATCDPITCPFSALPNISHARIPMVKQPAGDMNFLAITTVSPTPILNCHMSSGTCEDVAMLSQSGLSIAAHVQASGASPVGFLAGLMTQPDFMQYHSIVGDGTIETFGSEAGSCSLGARGVDFDKDANGVVKGYYLLCEDGLVQYCANGKCSEMFDGLHFDIQYGKLVVEPAAAGGTAALLIATSWAATRCPVSGRLGHLETCEYIGGDLGMYVRSVDYITDSTGAVTSYLVLDATDNSFRKCYLNNPECEVLTQALPSPSDGRVFRDADGTTLGFIAAAWAEYNLGPTWVSASNPGEHKYFPAGEGMTRLHGVAPYVTTTTRTTTPPFAYMQSLDVECEYGYKWSDGTEKGSIKCESNMNFGSIGKTCEKISCPVPARSHATTTQTSVLMGEAAFYTCEDGYVSDGRTVVYAYCGGEGQLVFPHGSADCAKFSEGGFEFAPVDLHTSNASASAYKNETIPTKSSLAAKVTGAVRGKR